MKQPTRGAYLVADARTKKQVHTRAVDLGESETHFPESRNSLDGCNGTLEAPPAEKGVKSGQSD